MTDGRDTKGKFIEGNTVATACKLHPPKGAVAIVRKLTAKGCSEVTIAKGLGVSRHTWENWRDEYPDIHQAWQEGRGEMHDALVGVLYESATKDKTIVSAMFLLKTVFGYKEGADVTVANRVSITFEVPGALKPDVYEAEIIKASLPKSKLKEISNGNG